MTTRQKRLLLGIVLAAAALLGVERFGLPETRAYLCAARSEVQGPGVEGLCDPLPQSAVRAPGPGDSSTAGSSESAAIAERASPATTPASPAAGTGADPDEKWWLILFKVAVAKLNSLLLTGANRSWEDATPHEDQAAVTYDAMALGMVKNDPVVPHTGEMTFRHPIVRIPGTGFDFTLQLVYRSGFDYNGPIGRRWDHNWNARIKDSSTSTGNIVRYANCRADTYTASGDTFTSPAGQFEKSVTRFTSGSDKVIERRLQDGTYELYRKPGNTGSWYFLDKVQHRDTDNEIDLSYDDSNNYRLTKITDTRGRWFQFLYATDDRISVIEDHSSGTSTADRDWRFAYDSGNYSSRLRYVISPDVGGTRRTMKFEYVTDANAHLSDVYAPREVAAAGSSYLHMVYDGSARVITQRFGESGREYNLTYGTNKFTEVDREGTTRIYAYDGTSKAITMHTVLVGGDTHDTNYTWDTTLALLTKVEYPEGNGMRFVYSNGRLLTSARCTVTGLGTTISRSGSDHLVTDYTYQSASNWTLVTKVTDPRGNDWQLTRDSLGNVTGYATPEAPNDPWVLAYDGASRLTRVDDPLGRRTDYAYGATGILTKVTQDPSTLNIATTYARDVFENITLVTNPVGKSTSYERNALGYVTEITTAELRDTDISYDLNDLVTEVLSDNDDTSMPNTRHKVKVEYNLLDIATKVHEFYATSHGSTRTWEYAFDKEDRLTLTTLPVTARKISSTYDARGLEVTRTAAHGTADAKSEAFAYDQNNRLTSAKDGLANETTFIYDGFDRRVTTMDPAGHQRRVTYDANGNVVTAKAATVSNVQVSEMRFDFDKDNRQTKSKEWAKKADLSTDIGTGWIERSYVFDKAGLLVTSLDPCGCGGGGATKIQIYDNASRLVTRKDALNNLVRLGYDAHGRTTKVSQDEIDGSTTRTYVTEYAYNADDQLTKVDDKGNGSSTALTTTITVDAKGRAKLITDPNGNQVSLQRDDFGREITKLIQRDASNWITIRTTWDLNDNVSKRIAKPGSTDAVMEYVYDNADRVITTIDEGGTIERFTYDDADNIVTAFDRNGSTKIYLYDVRNLVITKNFTLATNVRGPTTERFWYDALGRVTKAYNQDGLVERKWNTLSKLEQEKSWIMPSDDTGAGVSPREVDYTFDGTGRVTEMEYPDNTLKVSKTYDDLGRITKIKKKVGTGSWTDLATWTFQGPERMRLLEFGNGTRESMTYDVYGRATLMTHERSVSSSWTKLYEFERGYDAGSRPTFERRDYHKSSDGTILNGQRDFGDQYYYDRANRLTKVIRGVGYHSASSGHTLVSTEASTTLNYVTRTTYTLDDSGNRQTLLYDASDNSSQSSVRREDHVFDIENQLSIRYEVTFSPAATQTRNYTYDANGNQVSSYSPGAVKVDIKNRIYEFGDWRYRYDPFGRRVQKWDGNTTCGYYRNFYYDGVTCIQEYLVCPDDVEEGDSCCGPDPIWTRIYGPYLVDQILWGEYDINATASDGTEPFYFHLDYLGSVIMLTEDVSNPTIKETYRYDEYGQPYFYDGNGSWINGQLSNFEQDKTYTGRRWDPELSQYYYRHRYYQQQSGLFLSRDPIGPDAMANAYSYVMAFPTDSIDPMGLQNRRPSGHKPLPTWGADAQEACQPACGLLPPFSFTCPPGFMPKIPWEDCCKEQRLKCGEAVGKANGEYNKEAGRLAKVEGELKPNPPTAPNVPLQVAGGAATAGGIGSGLMGLIMITRGLAQGAVAGFSVAGPWGAVAGGVAGLGLGAVGVWWGTSTMANAEGSPGGIDYSGVEKDYATAGENHRKLVEAANTAYMADLKANCCVPIPGPQIGPAPRGSTFRSVIATPAHGILQVPYQPERSKGS